MRKFPELILKLLIFTIFFLTISPTINYIFNLKNSSLKGRNNSYYFNFTVALVNLMKGQFFKKVLSIKIY